MNLAPSDRTFVENAYISGTVIHIVVVGSGPVQINNLKMKNIHFIALSFALAQQHIILIIMNIFYNNKL